jgi:hypothetical protein
MGHGICCANFSSPRGSWNQCRGAWCAKCYVPTKWDKFPVKTLIEEDGTLVIRRLWDENKFLAARNGDHLSCPFQCDLCHFRNLKDRDPLRDDYTDRNLLTAIRPSNLDAFWGRAPTTVYNNLRLMLKVVRTMRDDYGVGSSHRCFPPQDPHPLEDTFGMFASCVMLEHSLNPGINEATVQFGTIRKTRSALSNYSNTTAAELLEPVLASVPL